MMLRFSARLFRLLALPGLLLAVALPGHADIATARQTCEVQRMAVCDTDGVRVYRDTACPEGSITLKPLEMRDCTNVTWDDLKPPQAVAPVPPHADKPRGTTWHRWLPYAALLVALAALGVLGITLLDVWRQQRSTHPADVPAPALPDVPPAEVVLPQNTQHPQAMPERPEKQGKQADPPAKSPELVTVYSVNPAFLWVLAGGVGLWGAWQISSRVSHKVFEQINHDSFAGLLSVLPQVLGVFSGSLAVLAVLTFWLLRLIFSKKVAKPPVAAKTTVKSVPEPAARKAASASRTARKSAAKM